MLTRRRALRRPHSGIFGDIQPTAQIGNHRNPSRRSAHAVRVRPSGHRGGHRLVSASRDRRANRGNPGRTVRQPGRDRRSASVRNGTRETPPASIGDSVFAAVTPRRRANARTASADISSCSAGEPNSVHGHPQNDGGQTQVARRSKPGQPPVMGDITGVGVEGHLVLI